MKRLLPVIALGCVLLAAGCSSYALRGTVVDGRDPAIRINQPMVMIVPANDPRLDAMGVASATVSVTLDPESMRPTNAGSTTTDAQGHFALPIGGGAGFLLYEAHILARRSGHLTAETVMALPKGSQRLLIVLPEGKDTWERPTDFVDETLEMGRPYMEGGR